MVTPMVCAVVSPGHTVQIYLRPGVSARRRWIEMFALLEDNLSSANEQRIHHADSFGVFAVIKEAMLIAHEQCGQSHVQLLPFTAEVLTQ